MNNKIIIYDQKSININGKQMILFDGEMYYFHIS